MTVVQVFAVMAAVVVMIVALLVWRTIGHGTTSSAAQLQKALPQAELITFEECGHLPNLEDRPRFSAVLGAFATRATSASR